MLKSANKLWVAKGKKVAVFEPGKKVTQEMVAAMLGPTGNLRAPTLLIGKDIVVGFNADLYEEIFA